MGVNALQLKFQPGGSKWGISAANPKIFGNFGFWWYFVNLLVF